MSKLVNILTMQVPLWLCLVTNGLVLLLLY